MSAVGNLEGEIKALLNQTRANIDEIKKIEAAVSKLIEEKTIGFPWLADAIAQLYEFREIKIAEFLEHKLRPALSSAERVREIASTKRELEKKFRVTRNMIKYYEALFPWLPEFVGEDLDDLIEQVGQKKEQESGEDPIKFYLTKAEYSNLSVSERNQKALDRYWSKKKSSWEIGRDYERYIGYIYEKQGYNVSYQGIEAGLEDLGRDLIAKRGKERKVIQCKYWAQHKVIHEKHICQLFGTTLKYWIEQKSTEREKSKQSFLGALIEDQNIKGVFVTSTSLSSVAKEFAQDLKIEVKANFSFARYPSIKCNISKRDGEKIYHLPVDQQYDRTIIEAERNELYAETVEEAESLGFRRSWRWLGDKS